MLNLFQFTSHPPVSLSLTVHIQFYFVSMDFVVLLCIRIRMSCHITSLFVYTFTAPISLSLSLSLMSIGRLQEQTSKCTYIRIILITPLPLLDKNKKMMTTKKKVVLLHLNENRPMIRRSSTLQCHFFWVPR